MNEDHRSQTEKMLEESTSYRRRIMAMQRSIMPGDKVKIVRDNVTIVGTVCEVNEHNVLIRTFRDRPCDKCDKKGSACENACKNIFDPDRLFTICRIYWHWFGRQRKISATYVELLKCGNK